MRCSNKEIFEDLQECQDNSTDVLKISGNALKITGNTVEMFEDLFIYAIWLECPEIIKVVAEINVYLLSSAVYLSVFCVNLFSNFCY